MKNLIAGIIAVGLVIWPVAALYPIWSDQNAYQERSRFVVPLAVSWIVGFIVAVSAFFIREDDSPVRKYLGRTFCVAAVLVQVYFILRAFAAFQAFRSSAI